MEKTPSQPLDTKKLIKDRTEFLSKVLDGNMLDIYEDNNHKHSIGSTIIDYSLYPPKIIRLGDGPSPL